MVIAKFSTIALVLALGMVGEALTLPGQAAPQATSKTTTHAAASTLTGAQILQRCQAAYQAVKTLDETVHSLSNTTPANAHIFFQSPTTLRVSGQTLFPGQKYDMISDGKSTSVLSAGGWQRQQSAEDGIASITGISGSSGTTVPAILTHAIWGNLPTLSASNPATVAMETINGQPTYRVSISLASKKAKGSSERTYWINSRTFFLVKSSTKFASFVNVVTYDAPIVNKPIPASAFQR